jgi:hypothetical protein
VPIGFANPVTVFSSTVVAMEISFAAQLRPRQQHFKIEGVHAKARRRKVAVSFLLRAFAALREKF